MSHSQNLPFSKHTQVQEFDKQGLCLPTKKRKVLSKDLKKKEYWSKLYAVHSLKIIFLIIILTHLNPPMQNQCHKF